MASSIEGINQKHYIIFICWCLFIYKYKILSVMIFCWEMLFLTLRNYHTMRAEITIIWDLTPFIFVNRTDPWRRIQQMALVYEITPCNIPEENKPNTQFCENQKSHMYWGWDRGTEKNIRSYEGGSKRRLKKFHKLYSPPNLNWDN